jgi:hypothetical protein
MKRTRITAVLALFLALLGMLALAACTSGDLGSEEIAFVRNGDLWTIDPDGANAFQAVTPGTPLLGYGLSPDHRIFVFRTLDSSFAKTSAGAHLARNPLTGLVGDVPSSLNTVGIDGGSPIPIISSAPNLARSNAWWSPDGNRLLYREGAAPTLDSPSLVTWIVSQNDQPGGIARKTLPGSFSIPSINSSSSMAIGNSSAGIFTTTLAGTNLLIVQRGVLPGHPLPASLERVLWQPAHQNPALLYAVMSGQPVRGRDEFTLMLRQANGQTRRLVSCACRQFSWSPNGNQVLYSTSQGYTVLNIQSGASFQFEAEHGAVPYWSPDSRAILLDGLHTLTLVRLSDRQTQVLLSDGHAPVMTDEPLPSSTAFLQPLENSLWNADGRRFVLVTRGRTLWQGQQLSSGNGLYMITLNNQDEPQAAPALIDRNEQDTQPGWSYADPNTSFLF